MVQTGIAPKMKRKPSTEKTLLTPQAALSANASTRLSTVCAMIAFDGVLNRGCTYPSQRGSTPTRAILYHILVAAFIDEISTAMTEFASAIRTSTQALPQTRWAMLKAGLLASLAKLPTWAVPQPICRPHDATTRKNPISRMDSKTPDDTVRRGLALSSASGAAASQPVSAKIANTTPR